jgi:hypothetical protein
MLIDDNKVSACHPLIDNAFELVWINKLRNTQWRFTYRRTTGDFLYITAAR